MAASIPTTEPTSIRRGDTVKWTKTVDDYSSDDGWSLIYSIRGPYYLDVTATAMTGGEFGVTVAATTTALLPDGDYWWTSRVSKSGEVFTVGNGNIEVLKNLSEELEYDGRSHAKRCLDSIEAAYEGRASRTDLEREIQAAGRRVREMSPEELITWRNYYLDMYQRELTAADINAGKTGKGYIHIRFN